MTTATEQSPILRFETLSEEMRRLLSTIFDERRDDLVETANARATKAEAPR